MNSATLRWFLAALVFVASIAVLLVCQRSASWFNLGCMLAALVALLVLLGLYNRKFL